MKCFAPVLPDSERDVNNLESQLAGEVGCDLINPSMVFFDPHHCTTLHMTRLLATPSHDEQDMADVLLAVQMERLHVEEALAARDNVVAHLEDAYLSVRQKAETILRLEQELEVFKRASTPANTNTSNVEIMLQHPGTPQADPGQAFEELQVTQAGTVLYPVIHILYKKLKH